MYLKYVKVMVFNATFNNVSVISWQSVLLMEVTRVPGETTDLPQVADKLTNCGDVYIYMYMYLTYVIKPLFIYFIFYSHK